MRETIMITSRYVVREIHINLLREIDLTPDRPQATAWPRPSRREELRPIGEGAGGISHAR